MIELPRMLDDFPAAPGLIKTDYTDFVVEEIPLYPADGVGTHTYFLVEKAGLTTQQAVIDIARALNVRRHDIGFAGQKDARAITRQWMSVEHVEPERVAALQIPRLRVLETTRHRNKLRLGHLRGNAFVVKVRQTQADRLAELQDALGTLVRRGVPNYFGAQRFGYRGDTWQIGRAIVQEQLEEAIDLLLGRPGPADHGAVRRARELYDRGKYLEASQAWPPMFRTERRTLKALVRAHGKRRRALAAIDRTTRTFYVSAYQSYLFNQVVVARLPTGLGQLWNGDLAWLHASDAVFRVEDAAVEQARADAFEISPTGPVIGYRMTTPAGPAGELEARILTDAGAVSQAFRPSPVHAKGNRRPLRYPVQDARLALGADEHGAYLELRFTLPRGCYATTLLRELFAFERAEAAGSEFENQETEAPAG
jgi:tRNA pseudouridine13 synthase